MFGYENSFTRWMAAHLSPWQRRQGSPEVKDETAGGSRTGAVIAVAGVACALTVMILTLGIARGFNHAIKAKLSGFEPTISVSAPYSYLTGEVSEFVTADDSLSRIITATVPDATQVLTLKQPAIIKTEDDFSAIVINTYGPTHNYTFERSNIVKGSLPDFNTPSSDTTLVISSTVADRLGVDVGDKLTVCFFIGDNIKMRRYRLKGIYSSGFGDYDAIVAYGSLHAMQRLNRVDSLTGTAVEIFAPHMERQQIATVAEKLQQALLLRAQEQMRPQVEVVNNITSTGAMYLNWLDLIDTNVVVIFALMCCVAALTLVSSLFIIILDRIPTIGILRALGASKPAVRRIFVRIALRLVMAGMLIGDAVALGFGWIQRTFGLIKLDSDMYYLSTMPFEFDFTAIALTNIGVLLMAWLVLILPARLASTISPARVMRYD